MSAVKFESPLYKVFEPGYHPQRPIIVDEGAESPETIILRHEEAINGGGLRGESPPGLLPMAAYKPQPSHLHGFPDASYSQYPTQSFAAQQTENAASQMNSLSFAANASTSQYMGGHQPQQPPPSAVNLISCIPNAGPPGTVVQLKVSSQYDITNMTTPAPYVYVVFGSQKCHATLEKEAVSQNGYFTFLASVAAPQFMVTHCRSPNNVPLMLLVEAPNGEELSRVESAGTFTYHDAPDMPGAGVGAAGDAGSHEGVTRKSPESPEQRESPPQLTVRTSATNSPNQQHHPLSADSNTNTYGYPSAINAAVDAAAAQGQQSNFTAAGNFSQEGNMLGTYRTSSFTDHYHRAPPALRTPTAGWTAYSGLGHDRYGPTRSPASIAHAHTTITRPSLTPSLPAPHATIPLLVRTSTLQSGSPQPTSHGVGYSNPWAVYPTKAVLNIMGNLDSMGQEWSSEEWNNKRRIVLFRKKQNGSHLEMSFRPVPVGERPTNSICISCIYWAEKNECFVTSVDTIHLLEQLVAAPARFTVEEKNRIRRNLEGFKPLTVSKAKPDSEEFFKIIMGFGNPKPRNIEKDVKVFPWKILGQALKKIISKYSASPSSTLPPSTPTHLLTPVSLSGSYGGLPPTPGSTTTATDAATAAGYVSLGNHASDSVPSPRSLSGASSWANYPTTTTRTLSPTLKSHSPQPSGLRISALPTAYDTRSSHPNSIASISNPYGLPLPSHSSHHLSSTIAPVSQSHSGHGTRWDSYDVAASTGSYSSHHAHGQVYGGGYGDSSHRA